jgi:hypothetical protein
MAAESAILRCGGGDGTKMRRNSQGSLSKTTFDAYLNDIPTEL